MKILTGILLFSFTFSLLFPIKIAFAEAKEVSSFELFWPIVPGKTKSDGFYFLKRIKENIRGLLIFATPQKADYNVFLATKRVVEAESLINNEKKDLAKSTLEDAVKNLSTAKSQLDSALSSGDPFAETASNIAKQAENIDVFMQWMKSKNQEFKDEFDGVGKLASEIVTSLKK